jgi:hypothetical protein
MLAKLMPLEIHADVNLGVSLVKCLRKIEEREAMYEGRVSNFCRTEVNNGRNSCLLMVDTTIKSLEPK